MKGFLTEIAETLLPRRDNKHGLLPPLLVALTVVTGLVDAFSYLVLGHVFVANMTGNVVFLGFALAGAHGFSIPASATAIASFVLGALVGGYASGRFTQHRAKLLSTAAIIQSVLLAASVVLAAEGGRSPAAPFRFPLIVSLAVSMGIQNATARKLAVPDLTTTVLTLTLTGFAADSVMAGGKGSKAGRRLIAVAAMLVGALVGALLIVHVDIVDPLIIALIIVASVAGTAWLAGTSNPAWVRPADGP